MTSSALRRRALLRDKRALRQAAMVGGSVSVEPAAGTPGALKPFTSTVRYTTADFFPMFGVPFRYGQRLVGDGGRRQGATSSC